MFDVQPTSSFYDVIDAADRLHFAVNTCVIIAFVHVNTARVVCGTGSVYRPTRLVKGKVFLYSLPSVGPGADPGVQAVSPQVT